MELSESSNNIILTPNRRLAATLQKQLENQNQKNGDSCWETPYILPINIWIQNLWSSYTNNHICAEKLLSSFQEKLCWEKIISSDKNSEQLLRLSETAETVQSANTLLKQWRVDTNNPIFTQTEDTKVFQQWLIAFESTCRSSNWITESSLPDILIEKIQQHLISLPNQITLFGFTEISPQLHHLFEYLPTKPKILSTLPGDKSINQTINRISLQDNDHEIILMARWAKSTYQKDGSKRIGCVIPNLDKMRDRVIQIFTQVFNENNFIKFDPKSYPFNISAGKSLQAYPIIKMALQLLGLNSNSISSSQFSEILSSPFIGEAEKERLERFSFDASLRAENINTLQLSTATLGQCTFLKKRIKDFIKLLDNNKRTYYEWSLHFTDILISLGWPGERSLNSEEYQTIDAWMALLNEFSSLDYVAQPVYLSDALSILKWMASNKQFQPESPETTIQILGLLEAASLPFDYLWVSGMDDASWPQQPNPNPFIPKQIQRELLMPHSTAERELQFCSIITEQFKQSAAHVLFSHAEKQDEIQRQMSPLLLDVPEITENALFLPSYLEPSERIFLAKSIEHFSDDLSTPYTSINVSGGVDILKQQALCPFRAFSTHRLNARELESPLPGLRPKDRGKFIHKILEHVWERIKNFESLSSLSLLERDDIVSTAIKKSILEIKSSQPKRTKYFELEEKRLHALITDWLDLELKREPFDVISHEKAENIMIGSLNLTLRVDRVDKLINGNKIIIDYKTGKNNSISSWFDERIDEPQLPIYALLDPSSTVCISFAQITSGENKFIGISQYDIGIPGIKSLHELENTNTANWPEQILRWRKNLETLSNEFSSGWALVNPKDNEQTCKYCKLHSLCRIYQHDQR